METKKKWYQTNGGIIALLILFFPAGLFLMWKHTDWNKTAKWTITGFFALLVLVNAIGGNDSNSTASNTQIATPTVSQESEATTQVVSTNDTEQAQEPTKAILMATNTPIPASKETVSQKNAVRKAQSYLAYSGFSRDGLVAQLEFEKFSHEDAVYGADNSGADWNAEAAEKAKSYMEYSGFSRDGLIEQLLFEKFTQEQAEYGANAVGL